MMPEKKSKVRSDDRILHFKPIPDKKILTSIGTVDPGLFQGSNKLHIIKNPQNNLWSFKYERGKLQEVLQMKFTSFKQAYDHAEKYFAKRGIAIDRVED